MLNGHRSWGSLLSVTLVTCPSLGFAQAASDGAGVIEEVVVSVERVTQSLQSYEGTAATISQSDLDSLGATDFLDLPALMPGVEISNYESNTQIYVRGIGSNANTELGDPAVAPHLDDVYVPRPRGLGVSFFDVERVEVNVGPQGTIRGRNALGGTINIVSRKPKLGVFEGYGEYAVGNYDLKELRGALNVPLGEITAARFSVYSATHDEYVKNTGPLTNLLGWESQDDLGARAHFLIQPSDQLSVLLSGDYLQSKGTGVRGVEMANASRAGIEFNSVDDPRRIKANGFSPVQDTDHWGMSLNATYKTDWVNVQYIGGYRDLHYTAAMSTNGRNYDFPGDDAQIIARNMGNVSVNDPIARQQAFLAERIYGNYSQLDWDTTSESRTHELRFTSPDSADRLTWAVGLYKFKEEQEVFLGIPLDYDTALPYLEFNQGSTVGESKSAYADLTFAATDRLRFTAGARYSDESKERVGFNFVAGLDTNGVAVRTGTPGFVMTGRSRTLRNPDADGDGVANTLNDVILLYRAGVRSYGINDTLDEFLNGQCVQSSQFGASCAGYPGLGLAFGGATVQQGENSDNYVDWRFRVGYDLTDTSLLYALIATGNKAPSFNDTVDLDPGAPVVLYTPPVGPEKATNIEIGSKNTLQLADRPLILNASIFYTRYTDQVFSTLIGLSQLDNNPGNDAGCEDTDPLTACPQVTLNQNIGKSKNRGVQIDAAYNLPRGFDLAATLLYQDSEYDSGSVVNDGRRPNPSGGTLQVDLGGNRLPLTPPLSLNLRLGQTIPVNSGSVDWIVSGTYKSKYFLTAFNGGAGERGSRVVTSVTPRGVANGYGADVLALHDEVDSYVHFDVGVGYNSEEHDLRVELFANNLTDEAHATQASLDTGSQQFLFNPPRTYGVRMHVGF